MDRREFVQGARVIGSDGDPIGTLDSVDTASQPPSIVVTLERDGRPIRIPEPQIDWKRSTADTIVTEVPGEALLRSNAPDGDSTGVPEDRGISEVEQEPARHTPRGERLTVPLAAEELVAGTHEVEKGRVVIHKRVETVPHEESFDVSHDEVDIERVPIGREVETAPAIRHEGDTTIVSVVEEELVVETRLRLVEEVRITKRRVTEGRTIREDLRREVVDVSGENAGTPDARE